VDVLQVVVDVVHFINQLFYFMVLKDLFHVLLELKVLKILFVFLKQAKNKYHGQGELNLIKLLLKIKLTLIYFGNIRI
jgi:hypothetical protein